MLVKAQVTKVEDLNSGISTNGLPYYRRTIVVAFAEPLADGTTYNSCLAVTLKGTDAQAQYMQFQQLDLSVTFRVSNFKGRWYQEVDGVVIQPEAAQQ